MSARIARIRHFPAGNRHARQPASVVRIEIDPPAAPDPAALAAVRAALPSVVEPEPGDGPAAAYGGWAAAVAAAIFATVGEHVDLHRVVHAAPTGAVDILIGHRVAAMAQPVMALSLALLDGGHRDDPARVLDALARRLDPVRIALPDAAIGRAATLCSIPWRPCVDGRAGLLLGEGARARRWHWNMTDRTPFLGTGICGSRWATNRALRAAGLPATEQRRADTAEAAVAAADALGYPVVLKPVGHSRGEGVVCGLDDSAAVARAFPAVRRLGPVLVEALVAGDDHRCLVAGGRLISAVRRRPAAVTGDGRSSLAALVAAANAGPARSAHGASLLRPLPLDGESDRVLARQGYDRSSVPPAGERVALRAVANWSQGGEREYVTDRIHPTNVRLAERAAALLGMDIVAVDIPSPDIGRPFTENAARIVEMQRQPLLIPATDEELAALVTILFATPAAARIPIVAIAGAAAEEIAAAVASRLGAAGLPVGTAGKQGLAVDGLVRSAADRRADGLGLLVDDPLVGAAVVVVEAGALLRDGLGHERVDVALLAEGCGDDVSAALAALADRAVVACGEAAALPGVPRIVVPTGAGVDELADAATRALVGA
ncbi:MAG: acetate--CoA ligase family protein [Alphaproteobacteria bacterium]